MIRILPHEVVNAYKGKGLRPTIGKMFRQPMTADGKVQACGLGAIMHTPRLLTYNDYAQDIIYARAHAKFGYEYACGFIAGFDSVDDVSDIKSEEGAQGVIDGKAAMQAACRAFPEYL